LKSIDYASLRKRILMFYFAAGLNLLMGLYVISAGGVAERGTLWLIAVVFLAFAGLNYYMARLLTKRWNAQVRRDRAIESDEVKQ
jgi:hypothetical protein